MPTDDAPTHDAAPSGGPSALVRELRAHPHRGPLGALALDVLGRQAEGRTQFVGREHVRARAAELGVVRDEAASSLCNVLDLLERGPESARERALVASLAVIGLASAVGTEETAAEVGAKLERAVRHAAWLEIATDVSWLGALVREAEAPLAEQVLQEIEQQLVDVGAGSAGRTLRGRAVAMALAGALAERAPSRARALAGHAGMDPMIASALASLDGPSDRRAAERELGLEGPAAPPRARGAWAVMRWVTGWAVLVGVARALAAVLGRRGGVSLTIEGQKLRVHESGGLLGASTRERTSIVPLTSVLEASRETRHGGVSLYAGAIAMACGVLSGGLLVFDGLRSGEFVLAAVGAALAIGGVTLDFAADWLARDQGRGITVELVLPRGRAVRVVAPSVERADAFLEALRARLR